MNKVTLNKQEATWLARNITKTKTLLEAASRKDPQVLERVTYKTINSLQDEAKQMASVIDQLGSEEYELDLQVSKKQKQVIGQMIDSTVKALEGTIIPEYQRRGDKFESYLKDAQSKVSLLKAMRKKFK